MTTTTTTDTSVRDRIAEEIRKRQRFVISSHVRPDGDAIGSQLAMAFALRHLGKTVRVVNCDMPPSPMLVFPGVGPMAFLSDRYVFSTPNHVTCHRRNKICSR